MSRSEEQGGLRGVMEQWHHTRHDTPVRCQGKTHCLTASRMTAALPPTSRRATVRTTDINNTDRRSFSNGSRRNSCEYSYSRRLSSSSRWGVVVVAVVAAVARLGSASELPERECCDSAPPPPPHYLTSTSTSTSTPHPPTHAGAAVPNEEKEPLNCLEAKGLCDEDANCSALLKVVPILCGPELVACSTVTVSRCQAALRTLVRFPWFQPTCLCREPRHDPQCNAFRDLLFDHPCVFLSGKAVDTDLLPQIPACGRAADLCRDDPWCKPRLDRFRAACKFRDGHCRNRDRERCVGAWLEVRDTSLLGCICPDDADRRCYRLYSLVNQNPCVGDDYPGRVAAMSEVSRVLGTPLTRAVPVPTAAASLLVVSASPAEPLYPLSTIQHYLQHLPPTMTDKSTSLEQVKRVVGTCHSAFIDCQAHEGCSSHLQMVNSHCSAYCHQDACRRSIQDMYKFLLEANQGLAHKIAFCVCRDGAGRGQDKCQRAQHRLHPPCAQRTDTLPVTQCHHLGYECRSDHVCRYRLEQYEVGCAPDLLTGACVGDASSCRVGVLGVLGTSLHTDCQCQGEALQEVNKCLAWKRLLWGNPCVVEAQLKYLLETLEEKSPELASPGRSKDRKRNRDRGSHDQGEREPSPPHPVAREDQDVHEPRSDNMEEREEDAEVVDVGGTLLQARRVVSTPQGIQWMGSLTLPPTPLPPPTTTTTITTTTTTSTTTTLSPTTRLPARYCEVRRAWEPRPRIIEEQDSIRLYKGGEKDCSEVCFCVLNKQVQCKVLECVENRPCETNYAVYMHNAPAYQAYRGECICYSGDFICMRPPAEEYQLPMGLFLMLGFSRTEEALLRTVTKGGAVDALIPLQLIVSTLSSDMGEECRVELFQNTSDNLVLQVRHFQMSSEGYGNQTYTLYMLQEERNRCDKPIRKIEDMINKRDPQIHHDVRLSLYVLAEVIDKVPTPQQYSGGPPSPLASPSILVSCWTWWVSVAVLLLGGNLHAVLDNMDGSGFWQTTLQASLAVETS